MGHQHSGGYTEEFLLADPIGLEPDRDPLWTQISRVCAELTPRLVFLISSEVSIMGLK